MLTGGAVEAELEEVVLVQDVVVGPAGLHHAVELAGRRRGAQQQQQQRSHYHGEGHRVVPRRHCCSKLSNPAYTVVVASSFLSTVTELAVCTVMDSMDWNELYRRSWACGGRVARETRSPRRIPR